MNESEIIDLKKDVKTILRFVDSCLLTHKMEMNWEELIAQDRLERWVGFDEQISCNI